MGDLSDEELEGFEHHGCSSGTSTQPVVRKAIVRAAAEIRRHRAAQTASAERVRQAVRDAINHDEALAGHPAISAVADRVAGQLTAVPAGAQAAGFYETEKRYAALAKVAEPETEVERLRGECNDAADRDAEIYRLRAVVAAVEGSPGWRAGIEASIRHLKVMQRKPRELWSGAYFAAVDEALVHLGAMLERGTSRATTPVDGVTP